MEKVIIYLPEVAIHFKHLVSILFEKEYFGFVESAEEYVLKIRSFIEENIGIYPAKQTPAKFKLYGENYILYKANKRTTWYIFFSQIEQSFFVKFITNNHTAFIGNFNP
ncbi:MAG TPA: hypothetical protein VFW07_22970 [Parafilimonas sp.]|nr:hypothetical protein [Parafilimonas sp.]